jgi:hypothetical protein
MSETPCSWHMGDRQPSCVIVASAHGCHVDFLGGSKSNHCMSWKMSETPCSWHVGDRQPSFFTAASAHDCHVDKPNLTIVLGENGWNIRQLTSRGTIFIATAAHDCHVDFLDRAKPSHINKGKMAEAPCSWHVGDRQPSFYCKEAAWLSWGFSCSITRRGGGIGGRGQTTQNHDMHKNPPGDLW